MVVRKMLSRGGGNYWVLKMLEDTEEREEKFFDVVLSTIFSVFSVVSF